MGNDDPLISLENFIHALNLYNNNVEGVLAIHVLTEYVTSWPSNKPGPHLAMTMKILSKPNPLDFQVSPDGSVIPKLWQPNINTIVWTKHFQVAIGPLTSYGKKNSEWKVGSVTINTKFPEGVVLERQFRILHIVKDWMAQPTAPTRVKVEHAQLQPISSCSTRVQGRTRTDFENAARVMHPSVWETYENTELRKYGNLLKNVFVDLGVENKPMDGDSE
jgi:hypothetical protein